MNNQAAAIMAKYNIPTVNLRQAVISQCGNPPAAKDAHFKCFNQSGCFCPHCPQADGVGYGWLAANVIVPAITKLLPPSPSPPPPSPPSPPPSPPSPSPPSPGPAGHPCSDYGASAPAGFVCHTGVCSGASGHCGHPIASAVLNLSGGCSFSSPTANGLAACAKAAAAACAAHKACASFAIDPSIHKNAPTAMLFADAGHSLTPNSAWNTWTLTPQ